MLYSDLKGYIIVKAFLQILCAFVSLLGDKQGCPFNIIHKRKMVQSQTHAVK